MVIDLQAVEKRSLLEEQLQLEEELLRRIRNDKLSYYKPHPKQDLFHKAGDFRFRMYRSGNRGGKTYMAAHEDVAWLLGERRWYLAGSPERTLGIPKHAVKGLVITTDWDKVAEMYTDNRGKVPGLMWQLIPPELVAPHGTKRNQAGVIDQIALTNGSMIYFDTVKSFATNPQGAESSNWDFIHIDEPCTEDQWNAVSRGLMDREGKAWFTLTPLSEPWIQDKFFPDGRDQTELAEIVDGRKIHWSLAGSTIENPYISRNSIADFEKGLSEDELQCRIYGVPLHLSGLVYKEFNPGIHVPKVVPNGWTAFNNPPLNYTIYTAIDPHPKTPHAVLFLAIDQHGRKFIFNELFQADSIKSLASDIWRVWRTPEGVDRSIALNVCDPSAWIEYPFAKDDLHNYSMALEFEEAGIAVEKGSKDMAGGILRVKAELTHKDNLYIMPNCVRTLWEINRYCWSDKENKPVDKDDHLMECLRRILLIDPMYLEPEVKTSTKRVSEIAKLSKAYGI